MMPVRGKRYSTLVVRRALELYLSSRCCYRIFCDTLSLPHPRTLKLKLGRIGEVGTQKECEECIKTVFETLTISEKRCCLLFDEMYVKPSIRFRGCHLIGYSEDNPTEIAKTILCFMIKPMFGKPAFVCRMAPVYKLSGIFVQNLNVEITQTVAKLGGEIVCLISDNLPTNRSVYQFFALSLNEPWLANICNQSIIMLHDPVHLFKSIRNNWLTEKTGKIHLTLNSQLFKRYWKDLVSLYEKEKNNVIKLTNLSYKAIHPGVIDRQNVTHMCAVVNEKTVAALKICDFKETSEFLERILLIWNYLNIKQKGMDIRLNDPNRASYKNVNEKRLQEILTFAEAVAKMPGGKGWKRNKSFTSETKISLSNMLYGIVDLIRKLLNENHHYILPGIFQTDRLEGELGIYRQLCGGSYHVSVEEVKNSFRLQRLKLFSKLDAMGVPISQCSIIQSECCQLDLNEDDISYLDTSVSSIDAISEEENAALYYISGYVQHKFLPSISVSGTNASEFTELVSRGRLCHPTEDLFQYVRYAYSLFILLPNAEMRFQCVRYISKLFIYFYTALPFDLQALPINTVVSTILNCFFKGLTKLNESSDKY
ncbi:uncharacterized protein LOC124815934 [Hydra vulgaris]|uniref:uncharacterized protein LOC124815934 n=1 Tax=Hydra vulgaris TaxID=6087 RepID=UPI001F5E4845|nr:uncharacterized protein LOC124815934 [Hydra vulgaris]XP_047140834.1 uncharacterized protein LOC124815934 [Hydra vulgaris]XP_047140841.1 uncharacterized protein LOC124815934 [Hydra vulgaris]XP_047140846.1 uncharacterized protein LOC124815934 [Hydra vulgaris]XP_047140852.1 uncharacterized protein LOC124815934 [Hydra vulgaris]